MLNFITFKLALCILFLFKLFKLYKIFLNNGVVACNSKVRNLQHVRINYEVLVIETTKANTTSLSNYLPEGRCD